MFPSKSPKTSLARAPCAPSRRGSKLVDALTERLSVPGALAAGQYSGTPGKQGSPFSLVIWALTPHLYLAASCVSQAPPIAAKTSRTRKFVYANCISLIYHTLR